MIRQLDYGRFQEELIREQQVCFQQMNLINMNVCFEIYLIILLMTAKSAMTGARILRHHAASARSRDVTTLGWNNDGRFVCFIIVFLCFYSMTTKIF